MEIFKTTAIANFLQAKTINDLALLYNADMEVQVNVAQDNGERITGNYRGKDWHGWTDNITTWKSFRIPWNANTDPEYIDSKIRFDLEKHVEGIGLTGWDWKNKQSKWVAFDFDSILGHSSGLSIDDLSRIEKLACEIPWVTVRKSTSGNGLHLYVFVNNIKTENHNEHAALARAIISIMSAKAGYDFNNKVDICGGNMWVWHRKMSGTDGLTLIKQGETYYDIPNNWRDHIPVINGRKRQAIPGKITNEDQFTELTGQYIREQLVEEHRELLEFLNNNKCFWYWNQDQSMLVTHTIHLKEAHTALNCKGVFKTIAEGTEWGRDHNCFCFPLRNGGWVVRRFTPGVTEAETWDQDANGWTRCYFNIEPDLKMAARSNSGIEHPSGGFVFRYAEQAITTAKALGSELDIPAHLAKRQAKLKTHKDGRVIVEIDKEKSDPDFEGWIGERNTWKKVLGISSASNEEQQSYDDLIRHIVTEQNEDCGWVVKSDNQWVTEPLQHVKVVLRSNGLSDKDVQSILGDLVLRKWTLVNKPFQSEYPGDRQWNRDACQLRHYPSKADNLHYPTWTKILKHVSVSLDSTILENAWCKENGIINGADYLMCWLASLFQCPEKPLPYLFFYGPEESGKSIFHEALRELITSTGYQRADTALLNQQGFNNELRNAIICVVEETDLTARNKAAYNRIKDWVTSPILQIHPKGGTPYLTINTTHWIQCSNNRNYCPIFPGDTRITVCYVEKPDQLENKNDLINRCKKEASDFLGELLRLEIPKSPDRLNVPIISTGLKTAAQEYNKSALDEFIEDQCFYCPGSMITIADFYLAFQRWMEPTEALNWSKNKVSKSMPDKFIKGRRTQDAAHCYGNISFTQPTDTQLQSRPLELVGKMLK